MKKLHRKSVRFKGLTIGLDLHKGFIQYSVFDRRGNEIALGRIKSSRDQLMKLIGEFRKKDAVQVAIEACGCFLWVFDLLAKELGREQVHVAQPARLAVIAHSQEKNDANDAWWLAYLLWEGRLAEAHVAEGALRELRIAGREVRWYTDQRSDLIRRLRSHLAQEGIGLPKGWHTSKLKREATRETLKGIGGHRGEAVRELFDQIERLSAVIARWRKKMEALSAQFPDVQTIEAEMPGLKTYTAGLLYGELGAPKRFRNEKAYAKGTGLTPGYRESGGKKEVCGITRAGSRHARWALTRAVIACMRCKRGPGAQVRAWVEKQCRRKKKKAVIVAAARKLAEGVWRLLSWGEVFDLRRAFPA
jgi:transposase